MTYWYICNVQGCIGGYTQIYAIYQPLVFLTAYTYLICHNKTGYMGIYTLTVNSECALARQTAEFLSLYILFTVAILGRG